MPTRSTNATTAVYAPSPPAATCPARSPSTRAWPGNSNWAFYRYDTALVALIGINQRAFIEGNQIYSYNDGNPEFASANSLEPSA